MKKRKNQTRGKNLASLKSVRNFKKNIQRTNEYIHSLDSALKSVDTVLEKLGAKKDPKNKVYVDLLEFTPDKEAFLFETGFISLFSNFELFTYELLKDLFLKYPSTIQTEKPISLQEISHLKNKSDIKMYFIDVLAIEKSYDSEKWVNYLRDTFRIKIFKNKKENEVFRMLNELRNLFLHGGGRTNSKFSKAMKGIIKSHIPLNQKVTLNRNKSFHGLYGFLSHMIEYMESQ